MIRWKVASGTYLSACELGCSRLTLRSSSFPLDLCSGCRVAIDRRLGRVPLPPSCYGRRALAHGQRTKGIAEVVAKPVSEPHVSRSRPTILSQAWIVILGRNPVSKVIRYPLEMVAPMWAVTILHRA